MPKRRALNQVAGSKIELSVRRKRRYCVLSKIKELMTSNVLILKTLKYSFVPSMPDQEKAPSTSFFPRGGPKRARQMVWHICLIPNELVRFGESKMVGPKLLTHKDLTLKWPEYPFAAGAPDRQLGSDRSRLAPSRKPWHRSWNVP
jgi:hypothetical protein